MSFHPGLFFFFLVFHYFLSIVHLHARYKGLTLFLASSFLVVSPFRGSYTLVIRASEYIWRSLESASVSLRIEVHALRVVLKDRDIKRRMEMWSDGNVKNRL